MVQIHEAEGGGYFFRVLAKNKKVLAHSEVYPRKRNAIRGATALAKVFGCDNPVIVDKTEG
jgi:uncharacterized protein YegP (UPF0339 family)